MSDKLNQYKPPFLSNLLDTCDTMVAFHGNCSSLKKEIKSVLT